MPVNRRVLSMPILALFFAFQMTACTHDKVATTQGATPVKSVAVTTPTAPVAETSSESPIATPVKSPDLPPAEHPASKPEEAKAKDVFTLKPGQSTAIDAGNTLHYVRMVNDSRCPPDVQCIWAGEVTIELMLDAGREKQTFTLKDDQKAASILGYNIVLISIDRNHLINVRVKKS